MPEVIGRCRCPVCAGDRASLRVSAKGLAYITCDGCNVQVFARSSTSDQHCRALLLPTPGLPAPPADPPPAPAPAPATKAPAPAGSGWGWLTGDA